MTETPPAEQSVWRTSADTREADLASDARARARARQRNAGWLRFVTVMLVLTGLFQIVTGLSALLRQETFRTSEDRLVLDLSYTGWGWLYLALGVVALAAAAGMGQRRPWARAAGVFVAALSALGNIGFLNVRPFAAASVITLNMLVIYGITVHGGRVATRFYADRA